MQRIILAAALTLALGSAYATSNQNHECQGGHNCNTEGGAPVNVTSDNKNVNTNVNTNVQNVTSTSKSSASATSDSNSRSKSSSTATGGNAAATGGNATAKGGKGGNATAPTTVAPKQEVTFNDNTKTERQAVPAYAPSMNTTASCRVGISGGVGSALGGISIGGAVKDDECNDREKGRMLIEAARIAQSLGAPDQVYVPLFQEGVELIRQSGVRAQAAAPASQGFATTDYNN